MKRVLLAIVALFALCAVELSAAVVSGKVMFLTKRGQRPVPNETLVWLEPAGKAPRKPAATFQMSTRNKTVLPHVLAIPAGSTVSFPNEDPISHNLFSLTPRNTFDLGLYRKGAAAKTHKFDEPGMINVYCNVHPNMSGVVHVMTTPYYGFADANGAYSFDVPAGKYRLIAWNEQGGTAANEIEVTAAGAVNGNRLLTIDGRNFRLGAHTNKEGKPYQAPTSKDY